jgi:hypothetical protein
VRQELEESEAFSVQLPGLHNDGAATPEQLASSTMMRCGSPGGLARHSWTA